MVRFHSPTTIIKMLIFIRITIKKKEKMKKMIFALGLVVALASCGGQTDSQESTSTDSTSASVKDSTLGTVVDSTKVDSTKVDSVKSVK